MSTFIIATFPDEAKAYEGAAALNDLHDDGSITLYEAVVVEREADGKLELKRGVPDQTLGLFEDVARNMTAGAFAVLAEVAESGTGPVDARIGALGGKVVRETPGAARATKKAEHMEASLDQEIADARDKLQRSADKARQRLEETKHELDERLKTLEEEAATASPEVRHRIDERIAQLRQEFGEREEKLSRAWEIAQRAVSP